MDGTILVADDDRTIRTVLTQALTRAGCKVHATGSMMTLLRWVEEGKGDLVITDVVMPDGNGIQALPQIRMVRPGLPVIVISAQNTIITAVQASEARAFDYLPKPFDLPDLMKRAARALEQRRAEGPEPAPVRRDGGDELPLIGRTPAMQAVYRIVAKVMNADIPVLITGASGTGKTALARTLHELSDRRAMPLTVIRPPDLAGADGPGRMLAQAANGTVLIEEVGDFDLDAQARIVWMLDRAPDLGVRPIATSQADLDALAESGALRRDLLYRMGGVTLALPALRDRSDDIPLLAEAFAARFSRDAGTSLRIGPEAMQVLRAHSWPGNVRQLEGTVKRLCMTAEAPELSAREVMAAIGASGAEQGAAPPRPGEAAQLSASIAQHLQRYFDLHGDGLPPPGLYDRVLRELEMPLLTIALEATGGNQVKCAELLGINRNTLRKKITDLDLRVTRRRKLM
ncbi:MAG: sigma-54 dependent transcriptional regulator [Rhodobacteraceae bacterium]|nr:sigma-54 dependent transcriptional regulator [Paracoccaceae bacterium]